MKHDEKELLEEGNSQEEVKKAYTAPKLTVYGNVEKLTAGIALGAADFPTGS